MKITWTRRAAPLLAAPLLLGGIVTTLAPGASADVIASAAQVALVDSGGQLEYFPNLSAPPTMGGLVLGNTSPAIARTSSGATEIAWTGQNGDLWTMDGSGNQTDTTVPMAANTSPAITALPSGGLEIAFIGSDGLLREMTLGGQPQLVGPAPYLTPAPGTSPAIAADGRAGFEIAITGANTNDLWTITPDGTPHDSQIPLVAGTWPGIAGLATGGYEVVFDRASTGWLWEIGPDGTPRWVSNGLGMATGTGPSVAPDTTGGFEVAFHAAGLNDLWTVTPDNLNHETHWPLADRDSPSLTNIPGYGFDYTFADNLGLLYYTKIVVAPGSSPVEAAPAQFFTNGPNVLGQDQDSAQRSLTAANLTVGSITSDHSCADPVGTVMQQSPAPGTNLAFGSAVSLTVESGTNSSGKPCVLK
jgi:hypothetical protein